MNIEKVESWIWSSDIWLPNGLDWNSLKSTKYITYPQKEDLYMYPIPFALLLICIRQFSERFILKPIGLRLGVKKDKEKRSISWSISLENAQLFEKVYLSNGFTNDGEIQILAKKLGLEVRYIERWIRRRIARDRPTNLKKFSGSSWKFIYYAFSITFGLTMLWDKSWLWDLEKCWEGYPLNEITQDVWWYYMLGSSYYWAQTFSHFFDIRRKDFWQMFVHHLLTVSLLGFSWVCNFTRIGTLVLFLHDIADLFFEFSKVSKYAEYHRLCNVLFGCFTISWIITRVIIFPLYLIRGTLSGGTRVAATVPGLIFNTLLIVLFGLHLFWTWLLAKGVGRAIKSGSIEKDGRSESDTSTSSENTKKKKEF